MIICWSYDDHLIIIWNKQRNTQRNKQTNKQSFSSCNHLMLIWWSSNKQSFSYGDDLLIILWSSVNYMTTNKQTNKIYNLVIIWLSNDDHIMIIRNKQTNKSYTLVIMWLSFEDHWMIIWNKQRNLFIQWSSIDHLMIIC